MHLPKKKKELKKFQPFHYSVVEALKKCSSIHDGLVIFELIRETEILANHDAIIDAFDELKEFQFADDDLDRKIQKTRKHLLAQKELAQEKSRAQNAERKLRPAVCR